MTQKTVYFDDLDESPDAKTILFALDGQEFEIDLAEKNETRLRKFLQEFIDKARKIERRPQLAVVRESGKQRRSSGGGRDDIAEIRTRAAENGYELKDRGRIPKHILDEYDNAHS